MNVGAVTHVSNGCLNFAVKLYEILARNEGNVLFSPITAHAILSLAYQGADGATADAIQNALSLADKSNTAEGYQNIIEKLNMAINIDIHIANKIYISDKYTFKDEFEDKAENHFLLETERAYFADNQKAAKKINAWVHNKTHTKIKDIISPDDLDDLTRLVLVNAVYFKGEWLHKFEPSKTLKEKFHITETEAIDCYMMHMNKRLGYVNDRDLNAQILNVPYKNQNFSFIIILPKCKTGLEDVERKLKTKSLIKIYKSLRTAEVNLALPKFKIQATMELNNPLSELGLQVIFSNNASFPHMLNSVELLKVNKVIQNACIEINEEGAVAAAATDVIKVKHAIVQPNIPLPQENFIINHSYLFIICFKMDDNMVPIFCGRVSKFE